MLERREELMSTSERVGNVVVIHPLDPADASVIAQIRSATRAQKGVRWTIDARQQFDALMEAVSPRNDVTFESATVGDVPGLWVHPASSRSDEAILHVHGGWFSAGSATAYRHEPTLVINNVTALAKTAKAYGVPTILTTINAKRGGEIFKQVQAVFPDQQPIDRTFINSWEDRRVVEAVKNTGRKKLVIAALWSEMCLVQPAIHAMGDGYDVYVVTDASGGVSPEAHDMAIRRVVAAGAQPITWLGMAGELQRDWARTERLGAVAQILFDHAGASGAVLAWELANEAQHT
jgi:nicotinamidase-related amidase